MSKVKKLYWVHPLFLGEISEVDIIDESEYHYTVENDDGYIHVIDKQQKVLWSTSIEEAFEKAASEEEKEIRKLEKEIKTHKDNIYRLQEKLNLIK